MMTPNGMRYAAVIDIDAALQMGGHVDLMEIPAMEFETLKVLANERSKWEAEEMKRQAEKAKREAGR